MFVDKVGFDIDTVGFNVAVGTVADCLVDMSYIASDFVRCSILDFVRCSILDFVSVLELVGKSLVHQSCPPITMAMVILV